MRGFLKRSALGIAALLLAGSAQSAELKKLTVNQSAQSLSAAAVYLANDLGYFAQEGLSVTFIPTGSGMKSIAPLLNGDTQFCICIFSHPVDAMQAGAGETHVIGRILTGYNHKVVLSKAVAQEKRITENMPLNDRIMALKGLKIGITEPNASTDQMIRLLMESVKLDPAKDAVLIALGAMNLPPALQNRQIDAYDMSSPVPEISVDAGDAITLVDLGKDKLPLLSDALYMAITVDPHYLEQNRATAVGFVRAIAKAQVYLLDHEQDARKILKDKDFSKMDQHSFDLGFAANAPFYPRTPDIVRSEVDAGLQLAQHFRRDKLTVTYEKLVDKSVLEEIGK